MKKFAVLAALGSLLLLSGCLHLNSGPITTNPEIDKIVSQVQEKAVKACGYLPTATTIISLFRLGSSDLDSVLEVVRSICAVVTKRSGRYVIQGVVVEGKFVRSAKRKK